MDLIRKLGFKGYNIAPENTYIAHNAPPPDAVTKLLLQATAVLGLPAASAGHQATDARSDGNGNMKRVSRRLVVLSWTKLDADAAQCVIE